MTGKEIIQQVREAFEDYDTVELFGRGDTYPSRDKLKHWGFEFIPAVGGDDAEWRLQVKRVSDADRLVVSGQYGTISADELDELITAGVEFSVE